MGSLVFSNVAYILFLSIAGGALIYVSMLMYMLEENKLPIMLS
ncbi:hypothetical protein [Candidatus Nitrosotalea okcheonensis]|uniref:Uncharacterized protein n=1 Tax=Candidatus Nitrosotalea okcheonensis TaxID=1903276 RepID=A0A2H1FGE2_9ARCH|nr:hypothetical protein [Candidatus Nitrosotalea okcheonensis]SMH71836.1 protein of unknown function [Candidatus Nitrosotalea okcheonensis]